MPPTDEMKKLSRTDHILNEFTEFLYIQGVVDKGTGELYANPLPYSASVLVPLSPGEGMVKHYRCLAMSLCLEKGVEEINIESSIDVDFIKLVSMDRLRYSVIEEKMYIHDPSDKQIYLIVRENVEKVVFINSEMEEKSIELAEKSTRRYVDIYALSVKTDSRNTLSIASPEPMIVERIGKTMYRLYTPTSRMLVVSRGRTHIQVFREALVNSSMVMVTGVQKNIQPLIEVLDPIAVSRPVRFDGGCVDLEVVNPSSISYNAMIKVYGYVDEIVVDDVARFKPKYNVIRLALPMHSEAKIRLCISTSIPRRADLVSALKEFLQAS